MQKLLKLLKVEKPLPKFKHKNFKKIYLTLKLNLPEKIYLIDTFPYGFAVKGDFTSILVFINSLFSWKKMLFILTHEIGHFYYIKRGVLKESKNTARENLANKRAVLLLEHMGLKNIKKDYYKFCNSI